MPRMPAPLQTIHAQVAQPFYAALGVTMSRWQHVETGLFVVAHALMATTYEVTSTVFFLIRSADTKLALVDKLCHRTLPAKVCETNWRPLRKAVNSYVEYRNGLAHFELNFLTDARTMVETSVPVILSPHHLDVGAVVDGQVRAVSYENLIEAGKEFLDGTRRLIQFGAAHIPHWRRQVKLLPSNLQRALVSLENELIEPELPPPPRQPRGRPK